MIPPAPAYWGEVGRLCREHDVLLIADEVMIGFGRTGRLWGSLRYGIDPIPEAVFRHGYTYSGHAAVCAAAMANLDIIEREDFVGRVRELEPLLDDAIELSGEVLPAHPMIPDRVVASSAPMAS